MWLLLTNKRNAPSLVCISASNRALALMGFHQSADVHKGNSPSHGSTVASQLLELLKDKPNIPGINLRPIFTVEPRGW